MRGEAGGIADIDEAKRGFSLADPKHDLILIALDTGNG